MAPCSVDRVQGTGTVPSSDLVRCLALRRAHMLLDGWIGEHRREHLLPREPSVMRESSAGSSGFTAEHTNGAGFLGPFPSSFPGEQRTPLLLLPSPNRQPEAQSFCDFFLVFPLIFHNIQLKPHPPSSPLLFLHHTVGESKWDGRETDVSTADPNSCLTCSVHASICLRSPV